MSLKQLAQMDSGEDLLGIETNKKILHCILDVLMSVVEFLPFFNIFCFGLSVSPMESWCSC
jgi:hypothetical protein